LSHLAPIALSFLPLFLLIVAFSFSIMSSVAPVPELFQCFFLATDAPMGQTWLLSTHVLLTELALHRHALASKVPSIAKARDAYGHFCTASHMNKVPGR
jgi:hypothetical protein